MTSQSPSLAGINLLTFRWAGWYVTKVEWKDDEGEEKVRE
jgi:hypothetical protein